VPPRSEEKERKLFVSLLFLKKKKKKENSFLLLGLGRGKTLPFSGGKGKETLFLRLGRLGRRKRSFPTSWGKEREKSAL